jgi:uncharacterized OB-fold protein
MSDAAAAPPPGPALPAPTPEVTLETQPYWDATRDGRLVLPQCDACGSVIWYPRRFCPSCGGRSVSWIAASGQGTIYTFTIVRKGDGEYRGAGPYVLAYVELDEGPRMMTNIVECDPDTLAIGDRVEVVFHPTAEGTALPRFRPVA